MKTNVGYIDKLVRILLAAVALVVYFTHVVSGGFAVTLLIVAAIFFITTFLNFCPIWYVLGISTKKKKYINQQEKLN